MSINSLDSSISGKPSRKKKRRHEVVLLANKIHLSVNFNLDLVEFERAEPMKFVAITAVLCCFLPTMITATFWGDWGPKEHCPKGLRTIGFQLKTERPQGEGDDTALNAIALKCSVGGWIHSTEGP